MRKNMYCKYFYWFTAAIISILLVGCTNYSEQDTKVALIKTIDESPSIFDEDEQEEDMETLEKVKKEILAEEPVYDVAVVKGEKQIVAAYKVKHMHRFRMKQIEKDINKMLEKKFPKEDFIISSDYKIFLEVIELINDEKDPKYSEEKANKKLQKIIKLQKELT